MSEEKKELKKELKKNECCEGKEELSIEELENVNGGGATVQVKGEDIAKLNTTDAASALQGKVGGVGVVVISSEGQPGSGMRFRDR